MTTFGGHTTEALRALCAGATAGPWQSVNQWIGTADGETVAYTDDHRNHRLTPALQKHADAAFIAAARLALPAALDRVAALEAAIDRVMARWHSWMATDDNSWDELQAALEELQAGYAALGEASHE